MRDWVNQCAIGDNKETMRAMIADGVKVQCAVTSPPYWGLRSYLPDGHAQKANELGLEATPDAYVAGMVEVFGLVRELLADDGTLWLNLGDSYSSGGRTTTTTQTLRGDCSAEARRSTNSRPPVAAGIKPKDLIGIPWRVAFALQADGWYLRQDIIWHKPNPMPESVTDRCTKSHEYIFLLSKRGRYYYDSKAIAEPYAEGSVARMAYPVNGVGGPNGEMGAKISQGGERAAVKPSPDGMRNRRSIWTVNTTAFSGAHFATFPPALIEPCILAGSRPGDIVLDPFFGSGTTGQVAQALGRQWIGLELNPAYVELQDKRTAQQGLVLA